MSTYRRQLAKATASAGPFASIGSESNSSLTARGCSPGSAVQVDQLLSGGGVFRSLVVAPSPGEPGEAHGQASVLLDLPPGGGVVRRQGELGGQELQPWPGLE